MARHGRRRGTSLLVVGLLSGLGGSLATLHPADATVAHARCGACLLRAAREQRAPVEAGRYEEVVEVVGRLGADGPRPAASQAHDVAVLDREDIEASGARSVPELLASLPGVAAMDQVGNGRQLSFGLSGFDGAGPAVAVFVDGVRLNDPETGVPPLELVRLEDLERVEVWHGPRGAVLGSGSLGGAVQLVTRRAPSRWQADARARAGSFDLRELAASGGGPVGRLALRASGARTIERGFRENARGGDAVDETSAGLALSRAGERVDASLTWSHLDGSWRQPGRVLLADLATDPWGVPWNSLDRADARHDLAIARVERRSEDRTAWVAIGSWRSRTGELLTTGTSGYGFLTRDRVRSTTLSLEGATPMARRSLRMRWGAEAASDRVSAEGFTTDDARDGSVDTFAAASVSDVAWDRAAVFGAIAREWPGGVVLEGTVRHDLSRVRRAGKELSFGGNLVPVNGRRSFSAASLGLGASGGFRARRGPEIRWRAAAGQSFQPPTALDLFAFPGFSSNPDLEPQHGVGASMGATLRARLWEGSLDVHATEVRDEIVYDARARRNLNASRTMRRGADLSLALSPHAKVRLDLRHAAVSARFRRDWLDAGGPVQAGDRVPLVSDRSSATLRLGPWRGGRVHAAVRRVGPAHLANDFDNSSRRLDAQLLATLSVSRDVRVGPGEGRIALHVDNLLDRVQAGWGSDVGPDVHVTPSPPRSFTFSFDIHF